MTLYQRIYSCKDERSAKRAWRIAGLFEWPVMAFMGVILGLFSRIAFEQGMFAELGYAAGGSIDSELGLPLLLRTILPIGLMGLMMSAYFSAIMSTADSCLVAASGNLVTDIIQTLFPKWKTNAIKLSQWVTFFIGAFAIILATQMNNVLDLMLYSYAIMVSGLIVPVIAMLFMDKPSPVAAMLSMGTGGLITMLCTAYKIELIYQLDPILLGISTATAVFIIIHNLETKSWLSSR